MPIQKDDAGNRRVEMELLLDGSPREIWQAMATGPGYTAWFAPTEIEERVGGSIRFDFGANGVSSGEVTVWQPPHRFGYVESEWSPGAPPVATEIAITARGSGQCVVRMIHSLFTTSDEWDDQMEGFEAGWPGFFDVLRVYLAHFAGMQAAAVQLFGTAGEDHLAGWRKLTGVLGVAGADVGETRDGSVGPERLTAVVERVDQDRGQRYVVIRLAAPSPGIVLTGTYETGSGVGASLGLYVYGDGAAADAAVRGPAWEAWFADHFPPAPVRPAE